MIDLIRRKLSASADQDSLIEMLSREAPDADRSQLESLAATLTPFLSMLPEALAFMMRASKDPRAGRAVELANGQIVHYVMDDDDLFPVTDHGIFGLVDDAFLVHRYAGKLLSWYPWLKDAVHDYEMPRAETFLVVQRLLPVGVAEALENTAHRVLMVAASLVGSGSGADPTSEESREPLSLRIEEALANDEPGPPARG